MSDWLCRSRMSSWSDAWREANGETVSSGTTEVRIRSDASHGWTTSTKREAVLLPGKTLQVISLRGHHPRLSYPPLKR